MAAASTSPRTPTKTPTRIPPSGRYGRTLAEQQALGGQPPPSGMYGRTLAEQQALITPPPSGLTLATGAPPPTPPDFARATSDAVLAARAAALRMRKRFSTQGNTGITGGRRTSLAAPARAVTQPRTLSGY